MTPEQLTLITEEFDRLMEFAEVNEFYECTCVNRSAYGTDGSDPSYRGAFHDADCNGHYYATHEAILEQLRQAYPQQHWSSTIANVW